MMENIILDAIKRANELGAQGIKVTGYLEPQLATQDPRWMLITEPPKQTSGADCTSPYI